MSKVRLVEGTAKYIEEILHEEEQYYELESLQFIHRSQLKMPDGTITSESFAQYIAVLTEIK